MKRILGTVIALAAALSIGSVASAAAVNIDVSGTGSVSSVSSFGPLTCGVNPCFVNPFSPGSSVSLDITGSAVSLTGGTLNIIATNLLGALGSIDTDVVAVLGTASGTLSGDDILWSTPMSYVATGTFTLHGSICGLVGAPCDTPLPIANLVAITGTTPVSPIVLGTWDLNASLDTILGSTAAVTQLGGINPPPGEGLPAQWYTFGPTTIPTPEPGALILLALGLGAISLRSRKA